MFSVIGDYVNVLVSVVVVVVVVFAVAVAVSLAAVLKLVVVIDLIACDFLVVVVYTFQHCFSCC